MACDQHTLSHPAGTSGEHAGTAHEAADDACVLLLILHLFVAEAVFVHREVDDVLAFVHSRHDEVGHEGDGQGYQHGDAPVLELVANLGEIAVEGRADVGGHEGDAAQDAQDLEHRVEGRQILEHIHRIRPAVLAVGAFFDADAIVLGRLQGLIQVFFHKAGIFNKNKNYRALLSLCA